MAGALDFLGRSVAAPATALKGVERDSFSPIDFPQIAYLARQATARTHLFCDVAERRINDCSRPSCYWASTSRTRKPWAQIIKRLHLSCRTHDEFLGPLDAAAQARAGRALIMIDALNEGDGRRLWKHHLADMLSILRDYPRVDLAVSCRTSYERVVVPDGLEPKLLSRAEHRGFASHEYIATRTFFDHYGIERPNVPLLIPEFSNPLFLKLRCDGLRKHKSMMLPAGARGITHIFNMFAWPRCNFALPQPDRLDFDERSNPVESAVMALARRMAETNKQRLPDSLSALPREYMTELRRLQKLTLRVIKFIYLRHFFHAMLNTALVSCFTSIVCYTPPPNPE